MPDAFIIFLFVLILIAGNAIAWLIRDIKQAQKDHKEIEQWLNQGEQHHEQ